MAKRIDRIIQEQIEVAGRQNLKSVDSDANVINLRRGASAPNFSSEVYPPSLTWRKQSFIRPAAYIPTEAFLLSIVKDITTNKTTETIAGSVRGGITDYINANDTNYIYSIRMFSRSDHVIPAKTIFRTDPTRRGSRITDESKCAYSVFTRALGEDGQIPRTTVTPTEFWQLSRYQVLDSGASVEDQFVLSLLANNWMEVALVIHTGEYGVNFVAFPDLVDYIDSYRYSDITPPAPPSIAGITSDYVDYGAGTFKNLVTIDTPSESDWLGVGIYKARLRENSDLSASNAWTPQIQGENNESEFLVSTPIGRYNMGGAYTVKIAGSTSESYKIAYERQYFPNLISNAGLLYDSSDWRFDYPGSGDEILTLREAPYTPPLCFKSSADYNGASKFDMVITTSSFPISIDRRYRVQWYTKKQDVRPGNTSALQTTYYSDDSHTLCANTAYQIQFLDYSKDFVWTENNTMIYNSTSEPHINPGGVTDASALSNFIIPSDCEYIELNFKMVNNSSPQSVIFLDGANVEVDSGQPATYSAFESYGARLITKDPMSLVEHTAYGQFRIPFRGNEIEVYAGHTTDAVGDVEYRSSAHWAKFAQGINLSGSYTNEVKNGSFETWGADLPTFWGQSQEPTRWPASTAVYGGTSLGFALHTSLAGSITQHWGGGVDHTRGWISCWVKMERGQIRIGDWYYSEVGSETELQLHSAFPSISAQEYGTAWHKHSFYLPTTRSVFVWSDTKGTLCYVDGYQVETAQAYANAWSHEYDTINDDGSTQHDESYVSCSSNVLDPNFYTMRMWYSPTHAWNSNSAMPRNVLWYSGIDSPSLTTDYQMVYWVPYTNNDSAGGYFEFYRNSNFGSEAMVIGAPRIEFESNEAIQIVLTHNARDRGKAGGQCKLFVSTDNENAIGHSATGAGGHFDFTLPTTSVRNDNFTIGAMNGVETDTAYEIIQTDGTYRFTQAAGVVSEFRIDGFIWDRNHVQLDSLGRRARNVPGQTLDGIVYEHITDRVRDGSESNTFQWSDLDVKGSWNQNVWTGSTYSYALDAFDYSGNRSAIGATASIQSGDTQGPQVGYTSTGYAVNKETNLTFYWITPTDYDFHHTRLKWASAPGVLVANIRGNPGEKQQWSAGFVGYGFEKTASLLSYDHHGNEGTATLITGRTKKGPLRRLDGSIFSNVGYGLVDSADLLFRADSLSWGRVYFTTTEPRVPKYRDIEVYAAAGAKVNPSINAYPMKKGSETGFELNTAYHIYAIDSADGRHDSIRMRWTLDASIAESETAYPIGTFYTGNNTARGYFVPHTDIGSGPTHDTLIASRIESPTGDTYLDLRNSVYRNTDGSGSYTEISGGQILYYSSAESKVYPYPRVMQKVSAGLINCGAVNSFADDWGLIRFDNIPIVMLFAENVRTYSTAAGFGEDPTTATPQSLSITVEATSGGCTPTVRLYTDQQSETHQAPGQATNRFIVDSAFNQDTGNAYAFPVIITDHWQNIEGIDTAVARDTVTGVGGVSGSGVGVNDDTAIARIDFTLSCFTSAEPRFGGAHIKLVFNSMACSAHASDYQNHGVANSGRWGNHKGQNNKEWIFSTGPSRTKKTFTFTRDMSVFPAAWKPVVMWTFASAQPKAYGAEAASEVTWTSAYYATSGAYWINDLKIDKITYWTESGATIEQTGTGIVSALVVDQGVA